MNQLGQNSSKESLSFNINGGVSDCFILHIVFCLSLFRYLNNPGGIVAHRVSQFG